MTGLVIGWLQRAKPELLEASSRPTAAVRGVSRWAWGSLVALIVLTPIGLLAPGTAWGEWGREELESLGLGYIPAGFDRWSSLWSAPFADYDLPVLKNPTLAYILSAVLGVGLALVGVWALVWLLSRIAGRDQSATPS